ncbi:MAG: response regulator transcription factor [Alphaproteobacteria bacterium]
MKILIAEDDSNILNGLKEIFENEGFETLKAKDGREALERYVEGMPDILCLDIMMPGISGYDVCREIRKTNPQIPIIFLSAKGEEIDKVLGLELGADDYIVKPFGVHEVVARIRAVMRRYMQSQNDRKTPENFTMNELTVYPSQMKAKRGGEEIELSLREVKILGLLHERADEVITRDALLDCCWGTHIMPESRTVDQHISNLRKRIEKDPASPEIIKTVHGAGYKFSRL